MLGDDGLDAADLDVLIELVGGIPASARRLRLHSWVWKHREKLLQPQYCLIPVDEGSWQLGRLSDAGTYSPERPLKGLTVAWRAFSGGSEAVLEPGCTPDAARNALKRAADLVGSRPGCSFLADIMRRCIAVRGDGRLVYHQDRLAGAPTRVITTL